VPWKFIQDTAGGTYFTVRLVYFFFCTDDRYSKGESIFTTAIIFPIRSSIIISIILKQPLFWRLNNLLHKYCNILWPNFRWILKLFLQLLYYYFQELLDEKDMKMGLKPFWSHIQICTSRNIFSFSIWKDFIEWKTWQISSNEIGLKIQKCLFWRSIPISMLLHSQEISMHH
jgi:hypothetical protein